MAGTRHPSDNYAGTLEGADTGTPADGAILHRHVRELDALGADHDDPALDAVSRLGARKMDVIFSDEHIFDADAAADDDDVIG